MIRRIAAIILVIVFALEATGCDAFRKKFVRKKNQERIQVYYEPEKYEKAPAEALYKKHYIYWKTLHEELTNNIGESPVNISRTAEGVVSNLQDMKRYLNEEKAAELETYIRQMEKIKSDLSGRHTSIAGERRAKRKSEEIYRKIKREFSYKKVKDYIRGNITDEHR